MDFLYFTDLFVLWAQKYSMTFKTSGQLLLSKGLVRNIVFIDQ